VATRTSWANGWKSSRPEDRVYVLMNLFGVHLPMLYGPGEAETSMKLQLRIMKASDDQSILAWHS
ncbi:hypothetical protein BKA83DRAFT_4037734, partial [Pisolithus microcarpus]